MSANGLKTVSSFGQSIWYDNIRRGLIDSGDFQRMIEQDDLRGVTSNPTIFDKAISGSNDYDAQIASFVEEGLSAEEIYWKLVIKDIQDTCDIFLPVHEKTGYDGFVSIEVSPLLAKDAEGTIRQALELKEKVGRSNVMIKVPATKEGLPAIRKLISEGIHVNVTLIFSVERYKEVMESYIAGLEDRKAKGESVAGIHSVASFFVSRVDGVIDSELEAVGSEAAKALLGKAAIANSKRAYQAYKKVFTAERFAALKEAGASVQRPLWASTSTKNPDYSDVLYVEELIGRDTVNTLPPATIDAFRDHGKAGDTLEKDTEEAERQLQAVESLGISLNQVTDELEEKGVSAFSDSFNELLSHLEEKRRQVAAQ